MNNTKWKKVFMLLAQISITKCSWKLRYDEHIYDWDIPEKIPFETEIYQGLKDANGLQPIKFKDIEWLRFPVYWETERRMRDDVLTPHRYEQDIDMLYRKLKEAKGIPVEKTKEYIIVYSSVEH